MMKNEILKVSSINKIDFEELVKDYKIINIDIFISYLKEIYRDLSERTDDKSQGVSNITFSKYYEVPGMISQRLFAVFDIDKNGYLDLLEFIEGLVCLFCENYERLAKLIFNFYDFDKDGVISKEDVRAVLSYVPLNTQSKVTLLKSKFEKETFKDRIESQEEIHTILEIVFQNEQLIDFKTFVYIIENVNSDIFLFILIFLFENRPFTKTTLDNYELAKQKKLENKHSKSPIIAKSPSKLIASPNLKSKFFPSLTISKSPTIVKNKIQTAKYDPKNIFYQSSASSRKNPRNILQKYIKRNSQDKTTLNKQDLQEFNSVQNIPVQRRTRNYFKNLSNKLIDNKFFSDSNNTNFDICSTTITPVVKYNTEVGNSISKELEELMNHITINDDEPSDEVKFEGFLFKITNTKKLKKLWFKLLHKDLYYYKKSDLKKHKGMHNLSGVFVREENCIIYDNVQLFCFSILYPKKSRLYYVDNNEDYKSWLNALKKATGYKNLTDIYDIKELIGKGKFGLIRRGENKQTNRVVAIKILSKTHMSEHDLGLFKTEIDILKICQHPNIITLYDVFENINCIFIIMEYCEGGDLFSYLEKREFKLSEFRAAQIIHKLCVSVYYLHSYGIAHRDLKPENILMTDDSDKADIRLSDFGLSKIIGPNENCSEPYGTLCYVAPEVLLEKPYNKQVDLWSIGVITYLLLSGSLPFNSEKSEMEIAKMTLYCSPQFPDNVWNKISPEAKNFVENLLQKNPTNRMTIMQSLEHPWLQKNNASQMPEIRKKGRDRCISIFKMYTTTDDENMK